MAESNKTDGLESWNFGITGLSCIPASNSAQTGWGNPLVDNNGNFIHPPWGTENGEGNHNMFIKKAKDNTLSLTRRKTTSTAASFSRISYYNEEFKIALIGKNSVIQKKGENIGTVPIGFIKAMCIYKDVDNGKKYLWVVTMTGSGVSGGENRSFLRSYLTEYKPKNFNWTLLGTFPITGLSRVRAPDNIYRTIFFRAHINKSGTRLAISFNTFVEFGTTQFAGRVQLNLFDGSDGYVVFTNRNLSSRTEFYNTYILGEGNFTVNETNDYESDIDYATHEIYHYFGEGTRINIAESTITSIYDVFYVGDILKFCTIIILINVYTSSSTSHDSLITKNYHNGYNDPFPIDNVQDASFTYNFNYVESRNYTISVGDWVILNSSLNGDFTFNYSVNNHFHSLQYFTGESILEDTQNDSANTIGNSTTTGFPLDYLMYLNGEDKVLLTTDLTGTNVVSTAASIRTDPQANNFTPQSNETVSTIIQKNVVYYHDGVFNINSRNVTTTVENENREPSQWLGNGGYGTEFYYISYGSGNQNSSGTSYLDTRISISVDWFSDFISSSYNQSYSPFNILNYDDLQGIYFGSFSKVQEIILQFNNPSNFAITGYINYLNNNNNDVDIENFSEIYGIAPHFNNISKY